MNEKCTFKLILKTSIYDIPLKCYLLNDVDPNILSMLTSQGYYKVKSNVRKKIFHSFIDNWIFGKIPMINDDNISEYELLSQEFDRIQNITQLYKKIHIDKQKSSLLKEQVKLSQTKNILISNKNAEINKYQQKIQLLKDTKEISTFSRFLEIKNDLEYACKYKNISELKNILQKTFISNCITFALDDDNKTAKIISGIKSATKVKIPRSIKKSDKEYFVTELNNKSERSIRSPLRSITFASDSCVKVIGDSSFERSKIQSLCIPASVEKLENGWYNGLDNLTELSIQPGNKNYRMHKNDFILGKSDSINSDFDTIIFANPSVINATIPSFVKVIGKRSFYEAKKLKKIDFEANSNLQVIMSYAFSMSSIESLSLPSSVLVLKDDWCLNTDHLTDICIIDNNQRNISYFDDKFVLGKSDLSCDVFDILLWASRDIETVTIPSFIKRIGSSAFSNCDKLTHVSFTSDSKIEFIENAAFYKSSIESILIPSTVTKIGKNAFSLCSNLKDIKFEDDSKLKKIGCYAFSNDSFESILIPPQVTKIKGGTFAGCSISHIGFQKNSHIKKLYSGIVSMASIETISIPSKTFINNNCFCHLSNIKMIEIIDYDSKIITNYGDKFVLGKSDLNSDVFDVLLWASRDIETVTIPSFIKRIGPSAFYCCNKLTDVYFEADSQLKTVYNNAFSSSSITSISLPSTVDTIDSYAFSNCKKLEHFQFPENENFETISECTFLNSAIENLKIPSSVTCIESGAFNSSKIRSITFDKDTKINEIGKDAFLCCYFLREISIPPHVTDIKSKTFYNCKNLEKVKFTDDSELRIIDKDAFDRSSLVSISIPANVRYIGEYAFSNCPKIQIMEFHENAKLHSIHKYFLTRVMFDESLVIMAPNNLKLEMYKQK